MALDTQNQKRFKLCVPLVQMTPIYHFQADEAGATLRATEVKPKLDRYLIHAAFHDDPKQFQQFCIAKQSDHSQNDDAQKYALNYRLSISVDDPSAADGVELFIRQTDRNGRTRMNPIGSIWDTQELPYGTFTNRNQRVTLKFFSRFPELIDKLEEWIDSFFAGMNFARRQSKGFGSFVTEKCSRNFNLYDEALKKYMLTTAWAQRKELEVHYAMRNGASTWKDALDDIRAIHKVLKSGDNRPNPRDPSRSTYIPSYLLKKYTKQNPKLQHYDNEKKTIKIKTLKRIKPLAGGKNASLRGRDANDNTLGESRFFRAMLGLPQFYEFRPVTVNERDYMARVEIIDSESNTSKVERFRSPICYKPVKIGNAWRYYLIPDEIPDTMFSHKFDVQLAKSKDRYDINTAGIVPPETITITTPAADEFDLLDLLQQFSNEAQTIGYAYGGARIQCTFGHLTIQKEERPDE